MIEQEESKIIEKGNRLELFLTDPAVTEAIARLEARYFAEFKTLSKPEDLMLVKAKVSVLEDFLAQMRVDVDSGKHALITRDRREKSVPTRGKGR